MNFFEGLSHKVNTLEMGSRGDGKRRVLIQNPKSKIQNPK
jgi:hypothetical protein